ncbi:MAG: hydroxymethylbilane synthase, partial [Acidimicrobiia bacterium]
VMLPQVAQGALAVECRADDAATLEAVAAIDQPGPRAAVEAERAFLAQLGGGCALACGALAEVGPGGGVALVVLVATPAGRRVLRTTEQGGDPVAVGTRAGRRLLDEMGGRSLLDTR